MQIKHLALALLLMALPLHAQMNTDRITAIGRNALYFEDYVLSIQYFNQVIRLKPYLSEPYQLRAIAKIQLGDYQGAMRDCERAIDLNPFQPGTYYTRGYIYRQLSENDKAEADFTKALSFSPYNKTYLLLRSDVRARQQRYDDALEDIDYLLSREPHAPSLLFEKGVICMEKNDTACALEQFLATTQYDRLNAANWSALGMVYLQREQDEEALEALNQSIRLGSHWAGDYINRGIIAYKQHNYRGALADYDRAIELEPNNAQCYYNRAMMRQEVGDYNRALDDYNKAIDIDEDRVEMRYQRATVHMQLQDWSAARSDFDTLIVHYPYFLPAYYLAAQASDAMGQKKAAWRYRNTAYDIEQKKDSIQAAMAAAKPNTNVQIAQSQPKKNVRKEFSARTAQNGQSEDVAENESGFSSSRGAVQRHYTDVVNEPNIVLSYYAQNQSLRRTNYYHHTVDAFNKAEHLPSPLRFTTQEIPLTAEMAAQHFEKISQLGEEIESNPTPYIYFARAIEFALVQDYASALDDATHAIVGLGEQAPALMYFCRANWRYKQLEYQRSMGELTAVSALDFEIMLRDLEHITTIQPDFAMAYYNQANILCTQKNYNKAIRAYTQAIEVDNDFAEAYFNRGLTRIYIGNHQQGLEDLSRAGELGIYQAYNLITRFQ